VNQQVPVIPNGNGHEMRDCPKFGRRGFLLLSGAGVLAACSSSTPSAAPTSPFAMPTGAHARTPSSTPIPVAPSPGTVSVIATGLDVPWGLDFLPNGDAVVAERETARVVQIPRAGGTPRELIRLPDVDTTGTSEGGLLGLAVSPTYDTDGLLYAYYTSRSDNRVVRFTATGGASGVKPIVTGLLRGNIHNGGRIAFGPDGKLYAGVGETGDRGLAQNLSSRNGKILRVNPDGSVPVDNPFPNSAVWSYGHRNVQGLAWDSGKRLWASEFGQNRFDEVNLILPGHNYGWPIVEGDGDTDGGKFTNPKVTWPTDEASPSGAAIIGDVLYLGALQGRAVLRVDLKGTTATKSEPLFAGRYGRIRTTAAAPDGSLWFTTSNRDGRGNPQAGDDHIYRLQLSG
jgi:glucose/arabinose dehydrogenase